VSLPSGAKILNAQFQAGFIVLWAEVDPTNVVRVTTHIIYLLFTGDEVPNVPLTYINTTQEPKSGIVVHIYEAK
jgi:hypothetical protein